jgi:cytochrome c oxidase assembly protein subunit 15
MASIDALSGKPEQVLAGSPGAVRLWLVIVAALVLAMVLVGGATRLTESGLSITQWKPVTGILPPLSTGDWQAEFDRYKQIPQYAELNADMTVEGFKTIFWWEWSHRLLARVVGLVYILPALWFWARGALKGALGRQVLLATALLALEPIVGWWMVSSGLSDRTEVAQDRLALHLLIASGVFGTVIYAAVGMGARARESVPRGFAIAAAAFALVVYAQLGLGALVAGLRAGLIYNTWPLMGSRFLPFEAFGGFASPLNDATTAQFDHRLVGYLVLAFALVQAFVAVRAAPAALVRRAVALAAVSALQVALGVTTLLFAAPLPLALAHQALALVLFGAACAHWSATRRREAGETRALRSGRRAPTAT